MKSRPRTPVYWPKMKIRGWRRRFKANQRIQRTVMMWATPTKLKGDGSGHYSYKFVADPMGEYIVEMKLPLVDGFGRRIS